MTVEGTALQLNSDQVDYVLGLVAEQRDEVDSLRSIREYEQETDLWNHALTSLKPETGTATRKILGSKGSSILPPPGSRQCHKGKNHVEISPQSGQQADPLLTHHASPAASAEQVRGSICGGPASG